MATRRRPGLPPVMRVAPGMTTNDEPVASSSRSPGGPRGTIEPATKNDTQVDLTAKIPEASAERPAKKSALQRPATLQHQTPTEQGRTLIESGPITKPVFKNLDNELEHICFVAERI